MKKLVSILLAALLLVSIVPTFAFAADARFNDPCVYFRGNGEDIMDEDGNVVYDFDVTTDQIKDVAARVVPLLIAGFISKDYSAYYKAFGEEMSKIYDRCQLDENGEPKYGTGITPSQAAANQQMMSENRAVNGTFHQMDYQFNNDWRLDPFDTVDAIDAYIDGVLNSTGKSKVNMLGTCLGGNLVLAYIAKHGTDKLKGIGFQQTVAFGAELIDESFSGNLNLDPDAIERFAGDRFLQDLMKESSDLLFTFLNESVKLLKDSTVLGALSNVFMDELYATLYEGLVPELVLATYGTWPGYWAMVTADHYASTRDFIFGQPGSERYEKYKGLIAKLDRYDRDVRQKIPQLLQEASDAGHPIAITVYYGHQMPPIYTSADEQSDVWTSVRYASLGATSSKIGTTFTSDYIAEREALGYGKYISPDKQIDASTGMFPDTTWFVKGAVHNDIGVGIDHIYAAAFNQGATVFTAEGFPQYLVFDISTRSTSPMTEENMNVESYEVTDADTPAPSGGKTDPANILTRILRIFRQIASWFNTLFSLLKNR